MRWLLLLLLVIPAVEIGIFVWAGHLIGAWWVVGLILLTGIIGITLAKQQGIETWNHARMSIQNGQVPAEQIFDGICILIGAVFLLTPGFLTDFFGFILVIPGTRAPFKVALEKLIRRIINHGKGKIIYRKW